MALTFKATQAALGRSAGFEVTVGKPDRVDGVGRKLHDVLDRNLAFNPGLDRALTDAGLVMVQTIPWGTDGPVHVYAECKPGERVL